jgi:hypothetical protein
MLSRRGEEDTKRRIRNGEKKKKKEHKIFQFSPHGILENFIIGIPV